MEMKISFDMHVLWYNYFLPLNLFCIRTKCKFTHTHTHTQRKKKQKNNNKKNPKKQKQKICPVTYITWQFGGFYSLGNWLPINSSDK